ncbi:MAG: molecular chaperone TorD family protein [Magnetococcales bacterium]|nr:molecular chaperone TorD family protein [Magnetococcales bacterium]
MYEKSEERINLPVLAEETWARSHVYALLAQVFRAEPDEGLIRHLQSPEVRAALDTHGKQLASFLEQDGMEQTLATLAEEYARLFLGPGPHISLHESVLVPGGGLLRGKEMTAVKAFMADAGFVLPENTKMLPDHLSVELEFMAHLCAEEAQAWLSGDDVRARNARAWQVDFLATHLGQWADIVKDRLDASHPSPFYAVFAALLCWAYSKIK